MILRTILVGVGGSGQWAVDLLGPDPKFNPVAIVEPAPTAAKVAQYRLAEMGRPGVPIFSGLTGALSQIEADALIICAPTAAHAEYCHMGFSVSMHVLVENPVTTDWARAKSLVAEAGEKWSKFCVVQRDRYSAVEQTVAHILRTTHHPAFPGEPKRVDFLQHSWLREGGAMDETATSTWPLIGRHADTLAAWLGPANRVTAWRSHAPWSGWIHDSRIDATIEYATGAVANYSLSFDAAVARDEIVVEGDRGALAVVGRAEIYFYPRDGSPVQAVDVIDAQPPERVILDEWFEYVVREVEPAISGRANLQSLGVCEMIARAAKSGRPVERAEL